MDLGNRGVLSQDEAYTMRSFAEYVAAKLVFPRSQYCRELVHCQTGRYIEHIELNAARSVFSAVQAR